MSRLTNRKLNKLLQDAVESVNVPDVREKVKNIPIDAVHAPNSTVVKKLPKKKIAVACVAMCCLIVMCTCIGIFVPKQNSAVVPQVNEISYVTIDINPSFTIKLVNGKVENISNNNKDAGIVLAGIKSSEIIGKDFDFAINIVLEQSAIIGFIDYSNDKSAQQKRNAVKIGVIGEDGLVDDTVALSIENSVKDFFKNNNLYALVVQDKVAKQANNLIMDKYGITFSKYELIKSVYRVENKKVFIDESDNTPFAKFVIENKDARVSDLYNRLFIKTNDKIQQIYQKIYNLIARPNEFNKYVQDNINKFNEDLDNFINTQIENLKEEGIFQFLVDCDNLCKENLDNLLKSTDKFEVISDIRQIIEDLQKEPSIDKEEIIEEIKFIWEWIDSLNKTDRGLII